MPPAFPPAFRLSASLRQAALAIAAGIPALDVSFARRHRRSFDARQLKAIAAITAGAAAQFLARGGSLAGFLEQVDYNGRRLAKLNVSPASVQRALRAYDRLLGAAATALAPLRPATMLALNTAYYRVREAEAQAFFDLFRAEVEAGTLDDLLSRFARILSRTFRARAARLYLDWMGASRDRRCFIVAGDPAEKLIRDPDWRGRYQSYWSIPFRADGAATGLIQLAFATRYAWLPRELDLLDAVAERCLAAAAKARLAQEVRHLAAHMFQVEEEERRRISRELHDEAGQSLLYTRLQLEMLEKTAPPGWEGRAALQQTRAVVERTILEIRRILAALSPAVLEQLGLAAAIRQLTARLRSLSSARVTLRIALPRRLPPDIETVTYRLLQECYHNIARHSAASHVKVSVTSTDGCLGLRVEDDGVGFDLGTAVARRNSFGLAGMRERVTLLGGSFEIRSRPGQGTAIAVSLPIRRTAPRP